MGIIFGWYSFKIKSYTSEQVGLNQPQWDNRLFEVRQKIFHLFWIPLIPIGKSYYERINGKLYYVPSDIEEVIKNTGTFHTPWYSFTLLIMLTVVLAGVAANDYYMRKRSEKIQENEKNEKTETYNKSIPEIENNIHHLHRGQYLKLTNVEYKHTWDHIFLHVADVKDSTCTVDILEIKNIEIPHPNMVSHFYDNNKANLKKSRLPKSKLLQAVCRDYDIYSGYKPYGADLLDNGNLYIIEQVAYIDRPIMMKYGNIHSFWKVIRENKFTAQSHYDPSGSNIQFELVNVGDAAKLVEISTEENEIEWIGKLPMELSSSPDKDKKGFHFTLKAKIKDVETPYKFKLTLADKQKTYNYTIEGKSHFCVIYESN